MIAVALITTQTEASIIDAPPIWMGEPAIPPGALKAMPAVGAFVAGLAGVWAASLDTAGDRVAGVAAGSFAFSAAGGVLACQTP